MKKFKMSQRMYALEAASEQFDIWGNISGAARGLRDAIGMHPARVLHTKMDALIKKANSVRSGWRQGDYGAIARELNAVLDEAKRAAQSGTIDARQLSILQNKHRLAKEEIKDIQNGKFSISQRMRDIEAAQFGFLDTLRGLGGSISKAMGGGLFNSLMSRIKQLSQRGGVASKWQLQELENKALAEARNGNLIAEELRKIRAAIRAAEGGMSGRVGYGSSGYKIPGM